ncbi:putative sodium-coupled neutral amino acid transporter 10 [Pseudomyrmex gracilis]|uniref:putative sodium-coupled neutral amino acid transporter 10 n=1 Tax=Pseudomyrmex gracilis TaxID=219809 RepID=UPI000994A160|nr:putative sodium-coupled neutral amino acid transporter 10 [Pseudomyrmex gracilis]
MIPHMSHVMTLANSIIGVSVLAMPFCFKQCGIVLAVLLLLLCSVLSRLACHFLIKSAVISRRRNFELLAFHAFGHMGKFLAELFIIGFMLGTCIAYFVVVGDLGPQIIGKMISKTPANVRTSLLVVTGVFLVLPLGLLRNIDSLASICTATIVFYICLVLKIMSESTFHIFAGDWFDDVNYWRPDGILQCLPIFSMALFCQTQLFEIYETIPNVSLEKMNEVVRGALNMCTLVYVCVGLFGYIAFCTQSFTGNILLSFDPSITSDLIKLGFVFSVAFSFPLVIFPCRASLNSLLFRRMHTHEPSVNYLPESRFRCLTIAIVGISLVIGILVPNIEFVLGIVGSTIGVMICLIFPAVFFISISTKNTNERLIAQGILFVGVWIMVLGTYANLYAMEESTSAKLTITSKPLGQVNNLPLNVIKENLHIIPDVPDSLDFVHRANKDKGNKLPEINVLEKDVRQEPPIPVERVIVTEKPLNVDKSDKITAGTLVPEVKEMVETIKTLNVVNLNPQVAVSTEVAKIDEPVTLKAEEIKIIEEKERSMDLQKNDILIDLDAIKKEESELAADGDVANARAAERHEQLRKTLEKHKLEQRQMMQEQKKILNDIKEQKQELEREKQRMAKDEKKVRINADDVLTKSKDSPRENGKKTVANSEDNIEKGKKALLEEKEQDIANNAESSGKQQSRDENHEMNIAAENSEKNLNLLRKMSHDANIEGSRKISKDAPAKSPVMEKITDRGAFEQVAPLRNEKRDEEKIEQVEFNNSVNMKGPILNVLSKGALRRSVAEEELAKETDKKEEIVNKVVGASDKEHDDRYSVPIALKMTNQSKADKTAIEQSSSNKSEPMILAIRRDILEKNEREKRDADLANDTRIDRPPETFESLAKNVNDAEICSKDNSKTSKVEKEIEKQTTTSTTTEALIKTNVYLSEQGMTKTIPLGDSPRIGLSGEYASIKQRDLKTLDLKTNIEI